MARPFPKNFILTKKGAKRDKKKDRTREFVVFSIIIKTLL